MVADFWGRAGGTGGVDERDEKPCEYLKCHLLLLTVPKVKERAVVPAGFMQESCTWDFADALFRAVADHGRTPPVVCK